MVKSALDVIKHYLDDIRSAVSFFLNSSNQRIANLGFVLLLTFVLENLVWIWM
jgi:hypothetical protein